MIFHQTENYQKTLFKCICQKDPECFTKLVSAFQKNKYLHKKFSIFPYSFCHLNSFVKSTKKLMRWTLVFLVIQHFPHMFCLKGPKTPNFPLVTCHLSLFSVKGPLLKCQKKTDPKLDAKCGISFLYFIFKVFKKTNARPLICSYFNKSDKNCSDSNQNMNFFYFEHCWYL